MSYWTFPNFRDVPRIRTPPSSGDPLGWVIGPTTRLSLLITVPLLIPDARYPLIRSAKRLILPRCRSRGRASGASPCGLRGPSGTFSYREIQLHKSCERLKKFIETISRECAETGVVGSRVDVSPTATPPPLSKAICARQCVFGKSAF